MATSLIYLNLSNIIVANLSALLIIPDTPMILRKVLAAMLSIPPNPSNITATILSIFFIIPDTSIAPNGVLTVILLVSPNPSGIITEMFFILLNFLDTPTISNKVLTNTLLVFLYTSKSLINSNRVLRMPLVSSQIPIEKSIFLIYSSVIVKDDLKSQHLTSYFKHKYKISSKLKIAIAFLFFIILSITYSYLFNNLLSSFFGL